MTSTAQKNSFRLVSVVMGEDTSENRSSDTVKLLNYGFNNYKVNVIKTKKETLGRIRVEKGKQSIVNLTLTKDATELLKNTESPLKYKFNIKVKSVKAPVKVGQVVGTAEIIDNENNIVDEVDVTVAEDIPKATILDYLYKNLKVISHGKEILKQS